MHNSEDKKEQGCKVKAVADFAREVLREAESKEHLDVGVAVVALEMAAKLADPDPYTVCPNCGSPDEGAGIRFVRTDWVYLDLEGREDWTDNAAEPTLECPSCGDSARFDPERVEVTRRNAGL